MKAYTDLEQSKKLAEILPLKSADMHYWLAWRGGISEEYKNIPKVGIPNKYKRRKYLWCPCWSLAALFNIFDWPKLSSSSLGVGISVYPNGYRHDSRLFDNPIDACYEMILRLHELNLL